MKKTSHHWRRADAMTEEEIHAAALADPDAQPVTPERLEANETDAASEGHPPRARPVAGGFAARFHIPLGTLRDWEQGRKEPDAAARAYLVVIARNPSAVSKALQPTG